MAFDTFVKLDKIAGESTDDKHKGEIEIYSFSWGASNPTTIGSHTTGAGAGKASFAEFSIMKRMDTSSPTLLQFLTSGSHIATGTVTMRKAGGTKLEYVTIDFTELFVTSWQISGSSGGDDAPTESVSFAFKSFKLNYTPQDTKGAAGKAVPFGYDLTTNKAA